jgi:NitT/TauT family transport system permease protein
MTAVALTAPSTRPLRFDGAMVAGVALLVGAAWMVASGLAAAHPATIALVGAAGALAVASPIRPLLLGVAALFSAHLAVIGLLPLFWQDTGAVPGAAWLALVGCWLAAIVAVARLSNLALVRTSARRARDIAVTVLFGLWMLILWEALVVGFAIPQLVWPAPSVVWAKIAQSVPTLVADFRQTILKGAIAGYAIGSGAGFLAALVADRFPFLRRGLLPVANMASALPIIGIAPIMVMWLGFDWPSKAAVVAVMTFFPVLVNTVAGLAAADVIERDLMRTYAASYWQAMFKLRLPSALPFIFTALKINTTLALIGAIIAEFFGTPIVGMGFRISTEVGRMHLDMVWAEIAVAALAGSAFYGVVALIERAATFWHPSFRQS